ncbi:MAG: class I SAM-dependent methyltransferase [Chloroflexi bacterium]|nr:MAG: class I SAM-dependent methyltransferase [Chloroflexota bacterium]TME36217.1 MAG: class I SAM-dependent methyltransferase [Chloroflexota bacterium]
MDLDSLYRERFDERAERRKDANWREICAYLQRYVPINGSVLDVGCDRGYFIRHIQARERWATDMRDMRAALPSEITFVQAQGERLELGRTFDRIFMSNLLEHLPGSDAVIALLARCSELLAANGQVIVLQPNIRLIGASYWDFIDHRVALTERSLAEAAQQAGLRTLKIITRFLPYTTKSRMPTHPLLVRAYLAFPPAWRLLGKQTLYIAGRA